MTYKLCDSILGKIKGPFICNIDGEETVYANPNDLMSQTFDKKYIVTCIEARNDKIVVTLKENDIVQNDINADWVKAHIDEYGKEPNPFDGI